MAAAPGSECKLFIQNVNKVGHCIQSYKHFGVVAYSCKPSCKNVHWNEAFSSVNQMPLEQMPLQQMSF